MCVKFSISDEIQTGLTTKEVLWMNCLRLMGRRGSEESRYYSS